MGRVGRILLTMALILASAVTFVGVGVTCGIIPTVNVVTM